MARVVAHSRNTALPFALGSAGHDVVLVDPESDIRWAQYTAFAEVIVLECEDPAACRAFLDGIVESARTADHEVRVLLLSGEGDRDESVDPRDGVSVLRLPLTMTRLNEALAQLLAGPPLLSSDARAAGESLETIALDVVDLRQERTTTRGRRIVPPTLDVDPVRHDPPAPRTISLVRTLTQALDDVASVAETAAVIVDEALNLVPSAGAAVLVRDGSVGWRVAAGDGLRLREERLTLSPQHWLVAHTACSFGVILTGGEGQWPQLFGVPLSWREHMLALQLPPSAAMLLLARDGQEYVQSELSSLVPLAEEAGQLLCDATDVRKLARLLEPYCDRPD